MIIKIRPFAYDTDAGFIYGTFTKGLFYGAIELPLLMPSKARRERLMQLKEEFAESYLKEQMTSADIYMACTESEPLFLIGYSIINNSILQWVFVKRDYQHQGIATLLTKNKGIIGVNNELLTRAGREIINSHPDAFRSPQDPNLSPPQDPLLDQGGNPSL